MSTVVSSACTRFNRGYRLDDPRSTRRPDRSCDRRASRRGRSGPAPRDERPPRRSDCVRPPGGRDVVGWFSAALYWLVRRPGNRLGLFLLALAVALAAVSLQGATQPQLRSIGVFGRFGRFSARVLCHLRVPGGSYSRVAWDGRCSARYRSEFWSRTFPRLLFSPVVYGSQALAGCNAACPANGFMIADRPTIADGFLRADISAYYLFAVWSGSLVYLIYRLATATRPRRRALLPVYVPA